MDPLTPIERRVLGVLVEKAKTTPDAYPLSLNAITTGANQKSNRDPVMNATDLEVEDGLSLLQSKGLVSRITGGRVERFRHNLYDAWNVDKVALAILAELLLRGAQTEGELRGRAGRMEPIEDLPTLRQRLRPMAERGLVVFLGEEGRRGTQITHGFCTPAELDRVRASAPAEGGETAEATPSRNTTDVLALAAQLAEAQREIAALRAEVGELRDQFRALRGTA